jgi:hypothetical protein
MYEDDGYDGVQYDTFYAPSPAQLEADAIRRECNARARAAEALAAEFGDDVSEWTV